MMVTSLRSEYEQLLYFSIPKLLHLYHNLMAETPNVGKIVNDVGILFQNKHSIKKQLKKTVKVRGRLNSLLLAMWHFSKGK